jgi:hypothetical protein
MQRVGRVSCRRPHPRLDRRWSWVDLLVFLRRARRSRLSILTSGEGGGQTVRWKQSGRAMRV